MYHGPLSELVLREYQLTLLDLAFALIEENAQWSHTQLLVVRCSPFIRASTESVLNQPAAVLDQNSLMQQSAGIIHISRVLYLIEYMRGALRPPTADFLTTLDLLHRAAPIPTDLRYLVPYARTDAWGTPYLDLDALRADIPPFQVEYLVRAWLLNKIAFRQSESHCSMRKISYP